jgi:hypothetical protein
MNLRKLIRTFQADQSGVAAVEMALVAPIIVGLAFVSVNLWEATLRRQQQDEALRVASQYYINGGSDDTKARQLGLSAWPNKPQTGDIAISRLHRCGESSVSSTTLCGSAQTPPATIVKIVASATVDGAPFQPVQVRTEMIRVR